MKLWESHIFRPLPHAPSLRHEFVIGPLCDSALFRRKARRYYYIRCNWHFLVCEKRVVVPDNDGLPIAGPDSSARFDTFAEGPCPALIELETRYPTKAYIVYLKPGRNSDERSTLAAGNIPVGASRPRPLFRVFSRDEIAELPTSLQIKFLCFVQDRCFERIGSNHTLRVDVRVVAASNRNLEAEVAAGRFREDLFYRLNVIMFTLPPLRERSQDILPFADWMLQRMSIAGGRRELRLSLEAADALVSYRWPGNVRELHNALQRAADLARTETITLNDLPEAVSHRVSATCAPVARGTRLKDFEREQILRALASNPTLGHAAAALGINVTTLWRKRRHYGIS